MPIEQLKVGDTLLAFDKATGMFRADAVKNVFIFPQNTEGYFVINERIRVTPHHRFYVDDVTTSPGHHVTSEWVEAGKLKKGDKLLNTQGKAEPITSIEYVKAKVTVYNLEVNPYHTFIAGDVVVHNMAAGPGGKSN